MRVKLPYAILLDLDDTIIANEVFRRRCWENICRDYASYLGDPSEALQGILHKSRWFWSDTHRHREWRQRLPQARAEIVALYMKEAGLGNLDIAREIGEAYTERIREYVRPIPGAVETVEYFRDQGVRLALVTNGNSAPQREKIERFRLASLFDYIYIEGEHSVGKPEPEAYIRPMEKLGARADETWMIGDKIEWEVAAPQRLGIRGIWINAGGAENSDPSVTPFLTLSRLSDIRGYL